MRKYAIPSILAGLVIIWLCNMFSNIEEPNYIRTNENNPFKLNKNYYLEVQSTKEQNIVFTASDKFIVFEKDIDGRLNAYTARINDEQYSVNIRASKNKLYYIENGKVRYISKSTELITCKIIPNEELCGAFFGMLLALFFLIIVLYILTCYLIYDHYFEKEHRKKYLYFY